MASLELQDPAIALCTCAAAAAAAGDDSEGSSFYAAAVTEGGEAVVWHCVAEGEAAVVGTVVARVRVGGGKAAPGAGPMSSGDVILAAALEAAGEGGWAVCW